MDAGRTEVEVAAKAGAQIVDVLGTATDATIAECVQAGKNYGAKIAVDLIAVADPVARARPGGGPGGATISRCTWPSTSRCGAATPSPFWSRSARRSRCRWAWPAGSTPRPPPPAVAHGAAYVIVGGAITKAKDPALATREIRQALDEGAVTPTTLFKRVGEADIRGVLEMVSSANLSDALHRGGVLEGH